MVCILSVYDSLCEGKYALDATGYSELIAKC